MTLLEFQEAILVVPAEADMGIVVHHDQEPRYFPVESVLYEEGSNKLFICPNPVNNTNGKPFVWIDARENASDSPQ